jgi:hypothetical protein
MDHFREVLMFRLEQKGIAQPLIPGFLRILADFLMHDPDMNLTEVNTRLKYVGWDEPGIDYHTLQLAIAYIETHPIQSDPDLQRLVFTPETELRV